MAHNLTGRTQQKALTIKYNHLIYKLSMLWMLSNIKNSPQDITLTDLAY